MLTQSFVMIIVHVGTDLMTQACLLHACVDAESFSLEPKKIREYHESRRAANAVITIKEFWKWKSFRSYVVFFVYSISLYAFIYFWSSSTFIIELTGLLSQLCDGLLAAPQAWKNCVKQSVKNLR
jgi:hypothetical protein